MYSNLMIPVSFDAERDTAKAIRVAQTLASPDARFTFVHVLETVPAYVSEIAPPEMVQNSHAIAKERLMAESSAIDGAQQALLQGPAGRTLTNWAVDHDADCIVIASHQPAFTDIFLGSTAAFVVRHAPCAVHVVR